MSLYFGFSGCSVSNYLDYLKPILKTVLEQNSNLKMVVFKTQKDFDETFQGIDVIYIDVTEVPTERPQNEEIKEDVYSGKKNHTHKWVLICDKNRQILFVSNMFNGKKHEFSIFKEIFTDVDFSALKIYVDFGFLGIKKVITFGELFIPYKGSKKRPLSDEQKTIIVLIQVFGLA